MGSVVLAARKMNNMIYLHMLRELQAHPEGRTVFQLKLRLRELGLPTENAMADQRVQCLVGMRHIRRGEKGECAHCGSKHLLFFITPLGRQQLQSFEQEQKKAA